MKKIFTFAMFATVLFYFDDANAKIRRVGYFGTPITGTDYADLQAAHDNAASGDTLLIFPGSYSTAFFSKKLIVIGYGYFVNGQGADSGLQVITGTLGLDIRLASGSDSTILQGLDGLFLTAQPSAPLKDVSIKRCKVLFRYTNTRLTNWQIIQSYINSVYGGYGSGAVFTNLLIENCIVADVYLDLTSSSSTGLFNNNVFVSDHNVYNNGTYSISNNIFLSTKYPTGTSQCTFTNNIATNNIIPSGNGNKTNVDLSTVFVGYPTQSTYSNDGRYTLAPGSPAKNAGEGGIDCGIFGGTNPYHLGGIPAIPSFYKLTAPSNITSSNPYTITFSLRSNN